MAAPSLKPKALREGDTVGLITPSTYVSDPDRLLLAERTLRYFNLKPKFGRNVKKKEGYVGGSVEERVSDLHDMFRDPDVKAIFCIRGGFGAAHILEAIDYPLIARNPKILLGYSDITALHLAIHRKTGLITFHGPVVLSRFSPYTQEHFRKAVFQTKPIGTVTNPPDSDPLRPSHTMRTVRPGKARGPLVGGNLTLISTTLGTPYEIDTKGKILFIEDVDEQPYSVDRMLTHLKLAGKLDAAAGIVFGECADCRPRDYKPSFDSTFTTGEVVDRILGRLNIPVFTGLTIGHTDDQLTLPLGVMTTLDADEKRLTLEESATTD
ncbi:MAG: LD-carboxypeptidase [Acidobacteria bacterium]|nr:LD-carboxypeptidase [Acidobacteriota bacterium]